MRNSRVIKFVNIFLQSVLGILLLGVVSVRGIEVTQSLDPASIQFEESAQFEIVITWPGPQSKYLFPKPLRPQFEKLIPGELTSSISSTGTGEDEITTKKYRYTLKPSLSGLGRIEPITIEYVSRLDSIPGQLVTEPMTIQIAQPKPISPKKKSGYAAVWMMFAIIIIGGGASVFVILRMRKKSTTAETTVTPERQFLDMLDQVQKESGNNLKQFQTGLYKGLVRYLMDRYQLPTDLVNAAAISEWLRGSSLEPDVRAMIAGWLIRAEKERFTPAMADPGATTRLYSEVKLIFETKLMK